MHLRSRGAGAGSVALLFAVVCTSAPAQVDVSQWPKVQVQLLITGAKRVPIAGLGATDIVMREDGKPLGVLDLQAISEPQSVCILIDSSGSMYSRMNEVLAAANHLLQVLPAGDEVCLASFGWNLQIRKRFTEDRTKIATGIRAVRAAGGTSLRDALLGMEDYMRASAKTLQRAIVVLTDGADNASAADDNK